MGLSSKMHGAGNDFIVADNKLRDWPVSADFIRKICDRKRGIGADGLILLSAPSVCQADIKMDFFNKDGYPAEMCGNGLRCAALFARINFSQEDQFMTFETASGLLKTRCLDNKRVEIEIPVVQAPEKMDLQGREAYFTNTGVPHLILPVLNVNDIDVNFQGRELRYHSEFQPAGTNVDFIEYPHADEPVKIRTYERGVEAETAACGTGTAAAALVLNVFLGRPWPQTFTTIEGDILEVDNAVSANKVLLTGPAEEVYQGNLNFSAL